MTYAFIMSGVAVIGLPAFAVFLVWPFRYPVNKLYNTNERGEIQPAPNADKAVGVVYRRYKPSYWYFESVEMIRKILLAGVIAALPYSLIGGEYAALAWCIFICSFVTYFYATVGPFVDHEGNILQAVCHMTLVVVYFDAILLGTLKDAFNERVAGGDSVEETRTWYDNQPYNKFYKQLFFIVRYMPFLVALFFMFNMRRIGSAVIYPFCRCCCGCFVKCGEKLCCPRSREKEYMAARAALRVTQEVNRATQLSFRWALQRSEELTRLHGELLQLATTVLKMSRKLKTIESRVAFQASVQGLINGVNETLKSIMAQTGLAVGVEWHQIVAIEREALKVAKARELQGLEATKNTKEGKAKARQMHLMGKSKSKFAKAEKKLKRQMSKLGGSKKKDIYFDCTRLQHEPLGCHLAKLLAFMRPTLELVQLCYQAVSVLLRGEGHVIVDIMGVVRAEREKLEEKNDAEARRLSGGTLQLNDHQLSKLVKRVTGHDLHAESAAAKENRRVELACRRIRAWNSERVHAFLEECGVAGKNTDFDAEVNTGNALLRSIEVWSMYFPPEEKKLRDKFQKKLKARIHKIAESVTDDDLEDEKKRLRERHQHHLEHKAGDGEDSSSESDSSFDVSALDGSEVGDSDDDSGAPPGAVVAPFAETGEDKKEGGGDAVVTVTEPKAGEELL